MTWNFSSVLACCFCFVFFSFLAVHHAHMKTPTQYREIASSKPTVHPMYDASFKL
jgi:hypothetical protein